MKHILLGLALLLTPSLAHAQCNGVFPANTLCGNLSGSPAPPSAFSASGTVVGPGSSVVNNFALWNNTSGTLLKDAGFSTGASGHAVPFLDGTNTWANTQTFPGVALTGSGSGIISLLPQAAAGTYNFNFPTTAGTSGQILTSAGGVAAPMTWTTSATQLPQPGFVTGYYNGSAWVVQKQDGTFVTTAGTTTCGIQEALNYAYPANLSIEFFGRGNATPCTITNTQISVPAQWNNSFYGYGLYLVFANAGQNGIIFNTQRYGKWDCGGCSLYYSGTGVAVGFQPTTAPGGAACTAGDTNCWSIDYEYNLGLLSSNGSTPGAMVFEDVSQGNGVNQLRSSTFGNNVIHITAIECVGQSAYGIRVASPVNAFQAGGENQYTFGNIEGCTSAEIGIGSSGGNANDPAIGTNFYTGNIGHTTVGASQFGIVTDSSSDVFNLNSINCYNTPTGQANVFWGPNALNNQIQATQAIGCAALEGGTTQTFAMGNNINGVWRAFTPTITCTGGTVNANTSTGRALLSSPTFLGKTINFNLDITLTTLTTCTTGAGGSITATVPFVSKSNAIVAGREIGTSGSMYAGIAAPGGSTIIITRYDNTCPDCISGRHLIITGSLEAQ